MVRKVTRQCGWPRCGQLVIGGTYCPEHQAIIDKRREEAKTQRDADREKPKYYSWYGTARWKRERVAFLQKNPLCVTCLAAGHLVKATVVDHVVAHKGNSRLFWDQGNWQSLCKKCHDSKTANNNGGFGNNTN